MGNYLTKLSSFGELDSSKVNAEEVHSFGGKMSLVMDAVDDGEVYWWTVTANLPRIRPRVAIPAETRIAKSE